ncbi:HNH endonuclease [Rhizobium sp. NZLR5]|nr:HNH endonuclease [Rhizobium sp. NZLR5]
MSIVQSLTSSQCLALADYLEDPGYGIFFDPTRNHDAWLKPAALTTKVKTSASVLVEILRTKLPSLLDGDAVAETLEVSSDEVEAFEEQIRTENYSVPDTVATVKTRGSAQRAFANAVKGNYGGRCAITGITTRDFLVASHIVPWSLDQSIRLDPSNGICLSLLMDRAFENGYLLIQDDLAVNVNWDKVGGDTALGDQLSLYDGQQLILPGQGEPRVAYLQRRRALFS